MATNRVLTERAASLGDFSQMREAGRAFPYTPVNLVHLYIKLEFRPQFENATNAADARGFLRSIARAATAAHGLAASYQGVILEVQGSILHLGLPLDSIGRPDAALAYAADLHWAFKTLFSDPTSRVEGWRMAADGGKTLVVAGRGVHGDDSWVSLGLAANRPAKYLYAQLELKEGSRDLRRHHIALFNSARDRFEHVDLNSLPVRRQLAESIGSRARAGNPGLEYRSLHMQAGGALGRAAPLSPADNPASPTADSPHTYFGWVMRADLDGFTARVEDCIDDDQQLHALAGTFYQIMDAAADFTNRHRENLAQFPWAGDNYTAAAIFSSRRAYDDAVPFRLVELCLDFQKEIKDLAINGGFGGWAYGIAGGDVHGSGQGNVYVGSVLLPGRRFLVGAGQGFGRSAQAFSDINPKAQRAVVFEFDWGKLDDRYKRVFEPAVTHRGERSSLYRIALTDKLLSVRARHAAVAPVTMVSMGQGIVQPVVSRPYFQ